MSPNLDFESPRLDVNGFVVDYISWRIEKGGYEWYEKPELPYGVQPEHLAMRRLASIFERRHQTELYHFAEELKEDRTLSFARYCDILEEFGRVENEEARGMSYGRLVGIISFSGIVAVAMMETGSRKTISQIVLYTTRFIDARIRLTWASDDRDWAQFMVMAACIMQRDDEREMLESKRQRRRWSLIVGAAIVGVGAIIGTKALLSSR